MDEVRCASFCEFFGLSLDDIHKKNSNHQTVLHVSTYLFLQGKVSSNFIKQLVASGADVKVKDINGMTLLHHISIATPTDTSYVARQEELINLFVRQGVDINAKCDLTNSSLYRAIKLGCAQGVEILAKLGVDVNQRVNVDLTALFIAVQRENFAVVKHLVELGADLNSLYRVVELVHKVVEIGNLDMMKHLIASGADTNALCVEYPNPIFHARQHGYYELMEYLALQGVDINAKRRTSSLLTEVLRFGCVEMLEYLVMVMSIENQRGMNEITALGEAVVIGDYQSAQILVQCRADVNVKYDTEISPVSLAMRLRNPRMLQLVMRSRPQQDIDKMKGLTALFHAVLVGPEMLTLLLNNGGDINDSCENCVTVVHDAVGCGDTEMVTALGRLGADMNMGKNVGWSLLDYAIEVDMELGLMEVLAERGVDLNRESNHVVTALHDSVIRRDLEMIITLGKLRVDMNGKLTRSSTLLRAVYRERPDIVRFLVEKGADMNRPSTVGMTPLHLAVQAVDTDIIRCLVSFGAIPSSPRHELTVLDHAISQCKDMVPCLVESGADINAKSTNDISVLHDAAMYSDSVRIIAVSGKGYESGKCKWDSSPLIRTIILDYYELTEMLLKRGADKEFQPAHQTPLDVAIEVGNHDCAALLTKFGEKHADQTDVISPLYCASRNGNIDIARLLIIDGCSTNKLDCLGQTPLDVLPFAGTKDCPYHVIQDLSSAVKKLEEIGQDCTSVVGCLDMETTLRTPGIGDVQYITCTNPKEISEQVHELLTDSLADRLTSLPRGKLRNIGSSAEGSRVGLPNEMDFLFEIQLQRDDEVVDVGNGYAQYVYHTPELLDQKLALQREAYPVRLCGSIGFHTQFQQLFLKQAFLQPGRLDLSKERKIAPYEAVATIRDSDRKACSCIKLSWKDADVSFVIPVDVVPSLHVDNWPKGARRKTWLMGYEELRSRGYVLVPKPPHVKSDLAKNCTNEQLQTLWKISFPHLETEHMQRLEQRIKDVYLTAKCLRNPDVCHIMIRDRGSLPKNVDKYLTSYMLKMIFFKNVKFFREVDLSLEEMVCKVYNDLEHALTEKKGFIPIFFLPTVSALSGIKVDVAKSAQVAGIMARFVRALLLRNCQQDCDREGNEEVIVYQRSRAVYRVYEIRSS